MKPSILNLSLEAFTQQITDAGFPAYRVRQVLEWIYKKGVYTFSAMSNLPKDFIGFLDEQYIAGALQCEACQTSSDGTEKYLFRLAGGNCIEAVCIFAPRRVTVCVSSQVGCRFGCRFCASGQIPFARGLTAGEMIGQVLYVQQERGHRVTNVVFMGIGEPLDNYDEVVRAIGMLNYPDACGIGARKITVSTAGVIPGIQKLAAFGLQIHLSVSLHAARDDLRSTLMPINKQYPLDDLLAACEDYVKTTRRIITFEYTLIGGINDAARDAESLARIARRLRAKINLLIYSPVASFDLTAPERSAVERFMNILNEKRISVSLRESKGGDINAACGQLALKGLS